jgi:hypothetical protein
MTEPETDLEMVGRIDRDQMAATKQDWLAYQACLEAWRERHPGPSDKEAGEHVDANKPSVRKRKLSQGGCARPESVSSVVAEVVQIAYQISPMMMAARMM